MIFDNIKFNSAHTIVSIALLVLFSICLLLSLFQFFTGNHISSQRYQSESSLIQVDLISQNINMINGFDQNVNEKVLYNILYDVFKDHEFLIEEQTDVNIGSQRTSRFTRKVDDYFFYSFDIFLSLKQGTTDKFLPDFLDKKEIIIEKLYSLMKNRNSTIASMEKDYLIIDLNLVPKIYTTYVDKSFFTYSYMLYILFSFIIALILFTMNIKRIRSATDI